MEKQFRAYYEKAEKKEGKTGSVLLTLIEHRLDNVVFRLGLASTRREARQLVNHAHFTVNGKKVNIPSYLVKVGDVIEVKEKSRSTARFKAIAEGENSSVATPKWLEKNADLLGGKVIAEPQRDDIDFPVEEHLIVELYSK
jgi:small subunit ribosomal protein S4